MPSSKNPTLARVVTIVLCGKAGQGIKTIDAALTKIFNLYGLYVFSTKEYMSRIRGGCNSTTLCISDQPIHAYRQQIDILIPFIPEAISYLKSRLSKKTSLILGKKNWIPQGYLMIDIDFDQIIKDEKNKVFINSIAIGVILGFLKFNKKIYQDFFSKYFKPKGEEIISQNINSVNIGYLIGNAIKQPIQFNFSPKKNQKSLTLLNGSDAISLGALAANCQFISSYPMSPSTGVLNNLASYSVKYDILVEQTEDEIAAINMAIGAWYAGARALVTTSGGGFALMSESMSLAGMTETPVVIHLGQRPGPATGLPTRTEQGDLNLVLCAGHGEFPRVIFAPGSLSQAFQLTQKAFDFADQFQVPVILLTDQTFLDSYSLIEKSDLKQTKPTYHYVKTTKEYRRYLLTSTGISPRGIPGHGTGLVSVDSDEHNESGFITEDFDTRVAMVEKRLKKMKSILQKSVMPEFIGNNNYKTLLVSWGSNYHVIKEALCILNDKNIAFIHFSQVYPIP